MKYDSMDQRITHCHAVRVTEPGQGDQPVIVEWKVPDPEPRVPNKYGSHIVVTISPNVEPPVYRQDIAPEYAFDYTIVSPHYTSSIDIGWMVDELCTVSDEGYLTASNEYGVEFWLRAQSRDNSGPGAPFDLKTWFVYRFHRCSLTGTTNSQEWAMVAQPDSGNIYTISVVVPTDKKEDS